VAATGKAPATVSATSWSYGLGVIVNRSLSTAVLGLAAAALSLTPAMAAPPEPASTVPEGVTLTACGYDVHATPSGKVKQIGLTTVFPNERVTLTNPETGVSVTYVTAGAVRVTLTDVGATLRFTGHNLVLGPGIGILYMTGNQTLVEDVDGLRLTDSQGKVLSVCGVLAP
jgi:hypothetical protein